MTKYRNIWQKISNEYFEFFADLDKNFEEILEFFEENFYFLRMVINTSMTNKKVFKPNFKINILKISKINFK